MWKKLFEKYKLKSFMCVFFLIVESFADIFQPALMAIMINEGVQNKDLDVVVKYGVWMILIAVIGAFGAVLRNILSSQVSYNFGADLRGIVYRKIVHLKKSQHDHYSDGTLMSLVTSDVTKIQDFVQGILRIFLKAPLIGIGSIVMTLIINPGFIKLYAVVIPVVIGLIFFNIKYGYPMFLRIQTALDQLNNRIQGLLAGIRVVKAFNQFDNESNKFDEDAKTLRTISQKTHETLALFPSLITLTINLAIVYILWQSSFWISEGSMAVGDMMAFVNYQFQVLFALIILARVFARFVSAKASFVRVEDLMLHEDVDLTLSQEIDLSRGIEFKDVSFNYSDGTQALDGISITIEPNTVVGIIGPTGGGKSTLTDLLLKHYEPTSGAIRIGEQDLSMLDTKTWRDSISIVPQKNTLFTGSIRENIKYGHPMATDSEILQSVEDANIHHFVEEHGIEGLIGRDGVNVSGGQKQRLSIARALVKKPKLLILDDSTSAVDVITENKIKTNLKKENLTVVLIAQRISSIMDADKILVMEDGKLIAKGNHHELLKTSLLYKEIFESQLGSEVLL